VSELTAANTAIVLDSTADYPDAQQRFANWRVVPLYVNFAGESFRDYVDLPPEAFYARLAASAVAPTTSQPSPGDFLSVYEELAGRYEHILSLQVASTLSGTIGSARNAAESMSGRVRVIDTGTVSTAITMLALALQRRLERGTSNEEVDALVERFGATHGLLFTVETLEYLARGGRIGRGAAFAGSLLQVKPILAVRDGAVVPIKRVRGFRQALSEFGAQLAAASTDSATLRIGIAHAEAPDSAAALEQVVREVRPQAQIEVVTPLGAVVGTHAGPGALGLFWFDDDD
jgi:DegV family protein with EDD domain